MSTMCTQISWFSGVRVRPRVRVKVRFRLTVSLVSLVSGSSLVALCLATW